MHFYSQAIKETMVRKLLGSHGLSANQLSKEVDIPQATLSKWLRDYGTSANTMGKTRSKKKGGGRWSKAQKLEMLLLTIKMSETELGTYLRKQGIFQAELDKWKQEFSIEENRSETQKIKLENVALKKANKEKDREIRHKDKALAEASALLVMKKKAELIWGVVEDDESD